MSKFFGDNSYRDFQGCCQSLLLLIRLSPTLRLIYNEFWMRIFDKDRLDDENGAREAADLYNQTLPKKNIYDMLFQFQKNIWELPS